MEYKGADDYHFWLGLDCGYKAQGKVLTDDLTPSFGMDNNVTRACLMSFNDGFYLGKELTQQDYLDLTTYPKDVIIENILVKESPKDEFDEKSLIVGNC